MGKTSDIGTLLKKIHRLYSRDLIKALEQKGFIDLRPSFLDILIYICSNEDSKSSSIKDIGNACGLKKQTMTGHLNELEKRGYIFKEKASKDKRSTAIILSTYGKSFKLSLLEVMSELEEKYKSKVGEVELERILITLSDFYKKVL